MSHNQNASNAFENCAKSLHIKPRKGTSNKGQEYEILLPALFSLVFYEDRNVEDFVMYSNIDNFGKFDDFLVKIQTRDGKIESYALQLTHTERSIQTLQSTGKNKFGILQHCESFSGIPNRNDFHYILYTNATFTKTAITDLDINNQGTCPGEKYFFQDTASAEILNFTTNSTTVFSKVATKEVCGEFFSKFALYAGQANWRETRRLIIKKFQSLFGDINLVMSYLEMFRMWKHQLFNQVELSKQVLTTKIFDLILSPYIITPSRKQETLLGQAAKMFDVTLIKDLDETKVMELVPEPNFDPSDEILRWGKELNLVLKDVQANTELDPKTKCTIGYYKKQHPILVSVNSSNITAIRTTIQTLKTHRDGLHFVLIGDCLEPKDFDGYSTFSKLSDLRKHQSDFFNSVIKQLEIKVLQKNYTYDELIGVDESTADSITIKDLHEMSSASFLLDFPTDNISEPYIPRTVTTPGFKLESIDEIPHDLIIITSKTDSKLKQTLAKYFIKRDLLPVDKYLKQPKNCSKLVLFSNNLTHANWKAIVLTIKDTNLHHLELDTNENLVWIATKGSTDNLKTCEIIKSVSITEGDLHQHFQNNINALVGRRGLGKSELLKKLKIDCPPDYLPIRVILKEHSKFLASNTNPTEFLDHFVSNNADSSLVAFVKRKFAELRKIVFFFDGVDELPTNCIKATLKRVKQLSELGFRVWLTSSPNLLPDIEDGLDIFASEIKCFSEEEQKEYIDKKLRGKVKNVDRVVKKIFENMTTIVENSAILEIPLQLFMITEVVIARPTDLNRTLFIPTRMFYIFFHGRYRQYLTKKKCAHFEQLEEIIYDSINYRLDQYQVLALQSCLAIEEFDRLKLRNHNKFLQRLKTQGDFLGIIYKITSDVIVFMQNIHAEYFAALWFAEHFSEVSGLDNILFREENSRIRLFFDMILGEDNPLHIAVLYKDITYLESRDNKTKNLTDRGGRMPLHIACSHGYQTQVINEEFNRKIDDKTIAQIKSLDEDYRKMLKILLERDQSPEFKDGLFKWNALNYADKTTFILPLEIILEKLPRFNLTSLNLFRNHKWTLLFYSAILSYPKLFEILFSSQVEPEKSKQLLQLATTWNSWKIVKILLDNHVDREAVDRNKRTALHIACIKGHIEVTIILLFKGSNVHAIDQYGRTPLHLASATNFLEGVVEIFKYKPVIDAIDKYGHTPLHVAVQKNHKNMVQFLLDKKASLNQPALNGWNPLHLAISEGHIDIIKMLLKHNAKVDEVDDYGTKPLHLAAKKGNVKIVEMILDKSKRVDDRTSDQRTSLQLAVEHGHTTVVKYLLNKNADVNALDGNRRSVLHWAVIGGQAQVVKLLLDRMDLKTDVLDCTGRNCLQWASKLGNVTIVKMLLQPLRHLINQQALNGSTALHWASNNNHISVVETLLQNGASIDLVDSEGRSSLYWAALEGQTKTVQFLLDHNASPVFISGVSSLDYCESLNSYR